jgi:NAD(P)-dependent dehydrogenase (short-subunit alcohol dehydrogenase family)
MPYKLLELTGKVAVVIGGTSGIGRAIAHGLAEAGADVIPTSRRGEQVDAAAADIADRGRRTIRVTSDVADRESLEKLLNAAVGEFGKVDILINCAGRTRRAPTLDFFRRRLERNYRYKLVRHLEGVSGFWTAYDRPAVTEEL